MDHLAGDPPLEGEGTWFNLTDVQFSVVALTTELGVLAERVAYDAYGRARHRWYTDLDGDGDGDSDYADYTDQVAANFTDIHADPEYRPDADHNRDGDVDNDDLFEFLTGASQAALTYGLISDPLGPDNPIGYDGYVFAPEAGLNAAAGSPQPQALGAYCVRFRWYLPETGRWLERDPAGYVDGMGLYEYARSCASFFVDPLGLATRSPQPTNTPLESSLEILGPGLRWTANSELWMRRLETSLRKLCPDAALTNSGGELILRVKRNRAGDSLYDQNDEIVRERNPGVPISDEPGVGIAACDEEPSEGCEDPPGCQILRDLAGADGVLVIKPAQDADRRGRNRNVYDPRTGEIFWPGTDPSDPITNLDGTLREARAWEVLWHELVHAHRNSKGQYLGPLDPNEEVETINAVNASLYDWYRRCSSDAGAGSLPDRDPNSH